MSSASALNLDWFKILSFVKELTILQREACFRENETMVAASTFRFSVFFNAFFFTNTLDCKHESNIGILSTHTSVNKFDFVATPVIQSPHF